MRSLAASARGEEEHRRVASLARASLAHRKAVHAGEHHVEDHEAELLRADLRERVQSVGRHFDGVALRLEVLADAASQVQLVVDQQDA